MNTHMPSALRRAACVFLAALLCLSFMAPTVAEAAVTQADIDALKKEAQQQKIGIKESVVCAE